MLHVQTVWQVPPLPSSFCSLHLHLAQLCAQVNKLDLSERKSSSIMGVSCLSFFLNGSHYNFFFFPFCLSENRMFLGQNPCWSCAVFGVQCLLKSHESLRLFFSQILICANRFS